MNEGLSCFTLYISMATWWIFLWWNNRDPSSSTAISWSLTTTLTCIDWVIPESCCTRCLSEDFPSGNWWCWRLFFHQRSWRCCGIALISYMLFCLSLSTSQFPAGGGDKGLSKELLIIFLKFLPVFFLTLQFPYLDKFRNNCAVVWHSKKGKKSRNADNFIFRSQKRKKIDTLRGNGDRNAFMLSWRLDECRQGRNGGKSNIFDPFVIFSS